MNMGAVGDRKGKVVIVNILSNVILDRCQKFVVRRLSGGRASPESGFLQVHNVVFCGLEVVFWGLAGGFLRPGWWFSAAWQVVFCGLAGGSLRLGGGFLRLGRRFSAAWQVVLCGSAAVLGGWAVVLCGFRFPPASADGLLCLRCSVVAAS
jgi:hypothetical protein